MDKLRVYDDTLNKCLNLIKGVKKAIQNLCAGLFVSIPYRDKVLGMELHGFRRFNHTARRFQGIHLLLGEGFKGYNHSRKGFKGNNHTRRRVHL